MMNDLREDVRGHCSRPCVYRDKNNRCDMWDELSVPDDVSHCDNFIEDE